MRREYHFSNSRESREALRGQCPEFQLSRKDLPPLRGWGILFFCLALTLRLRSGQAGRANFSRASGARGGMGEEGGEQVEEMEI
jgi:hypothetical protein